LQSLVDPKSKPLEHQKAGIKITDLREKFAKTCMAKCENCNYCPEHGSYKRFKTEDGGELIVFKIDPVCAKYQLKNDH